MTMSKTARAAALVAMLIATPALAQEAIQEPGAFAFNHPDADVLNGGESVRVEALGAASPVPFGSGGAYSYAYYMGPARAVRHGRAISRGVATPTDAMPLAYDMDGRACIPAPRVGAFATQPWDIQTPCEPVY